MTNHWTRNTNADPDLAFDCGLGTVYVTSDETTITISAFPPGVTSNPVNQLTFKAPFCGFQGQNWEISCRDRYTHIYIGELMLAFKEEAEGIVVDVWNGDHLIETMAVWAEDLV